ncbi:hypothetical protein GCM10018793_05490 [Streptomyces sulfonofaciens]|uniref:PASTA domain-containing protein n=1 Tax=Streptomyces sulfonofaciens TaxID=68272 RepID=A0A919FRW2_9ACTN|nr:PASTA domain-containing protein [Streptomyces sulfonofaciens]GHH70833.1 hypothetical protein GCM10018793_05490 [Streptomyces sulfonofaciens]
MNQPSSPPPRTAARPWWRTTPAALGLLVLVAVLGALSLPLGFLVLIASVVALWMLPPWRWFTRLGATVGAFFLLTIGAGLGGQLDDTGKEKANQVAVGTGTPAPSSATGSPRASLHAPDLTGSHLDEAEDRARDAGFTTGHHDASPAGRTVVVRSGWVVCFQQAEHDGGREVIEFAAVKDREPCPEEDGGRIPWPAMPDLIGKTWRTAVAELADRGVDGHDVTAEARYLNDALPEGGHDSWRVCEQDPAEGEDITSQVTLGLAHPAAGCSTDGSYLGDRDHDGRPDYRDHSDDRATTGGGAPGGSSTAGGTSGGSAASSTGGGGSGDGSSGGSSGGSSTGGGGSSATGGGGPIVHPGAFCAPAGATGVTSAGTPMVCGPASDGRNRWHHA